MTARKVARPAVASSLVDSLRASSRPAREVTARKPVLAKVTSAAGSTDLTRKDREVMLGSVEVVRLSIAEAVAGAVSALQDLTLTGVLPAEVTLTARTDGDVSANLPVRYETGDGPRYLNFTVRLSGIVGETLRPFAGTPDSKDEAAAPAPAPRPRARRTSK